MKKTIIIKALSLMTIMFVSQAGAEFTVGPNPFPDDSPSLSFYEYPATDSGFSYYLTMSADPFTGQGFNIPQFTLQNTTSPGDILGSPEIVSFTLALPEGSPYNFDTVEQIQILNDTGASLIIDIAGSEPPDVLLYPHDPTLGDNGLRSDVIQVNFLAGFDPGDVIAFSVDIDSDGVTNPGDIVDARMILFNNEGANSTFAVTFGGDVIPEPATLTLLTLGLAGLSWKKRS